MAASVARSAGRGLEGSCRAGDWVRAASPWEGVELLRAWFSGRAYARHRHDTYAIGVTETGLQAFDYRGRAERSGPGQVVVLHPDEAHDGRAGTGAGFGYRIVYVAPALIAAAVGAIRERGAALPFARQPVSGSRTLAGAVRAAFRCESEPLAVDALVVRLAEGLLEEEGLAVDPPRRLDHAALGRVRSFLDVQRTVVRSADLERIGGLGRYELARQFRAWHGTSPYRYSLMRRLAFGRSLLGGSRPLAQVALAAGFADQAHFTRMFRSAFGVTPGRYVGWRARAGGAGPPADPGTLPSRRR